MRLFIGQHAGFFKSLFRAVAASVAVMTPLLDVQHVSKHFGGVAALDDCSLSLRKGEVTGLIGPNGAGKTTLLNVISGLIKCDNR